MEEPPRIEPKPLLDGYAQKVVKLGGRRIVATVIVTAVAGAIGAYATRGWWPDSSRSQPAGEAKSAGDPAATAATTPAENAAASFDGTYEGRWTPADSRQDEMIITIEGETVVGRTKFTIETADIAAGMGLKLEGPSTITTTLNIHGQISKTGQITAKVNGDEDSPGLTQAVSGELKGWVQGDTLGVSYDGKGSNGAVIRGGGTLRKRP